MQIPSWMCRSGRNLPLPRDGSSAGKPIGTEQIPTKSLLRLPNRESGRHGWKLPGKRGWMAQPGRWRRCPMKEIWPSTSTGFCGWRTTDIFSAMRTAPRFSGWGIPIGNLHTGKDGMNPTIPEWTACSGEWRTGAYGRATPCTKPICAATGPWAETDCTGTKPAPRTCPI